MMARRNNRGGPNSERFTAENLDSIQWGDAPIPPRMVTGRPAGYSDSESESDTEFYCPSSDHFKLKTHGKPINPPKVVPPMEQLRIACMELNIDKAIQLLDEGKITIDSRCPTSGWNALLYAVRECFVALVEKLLDRGTNVNFKATLPGDGLSALMVLCIASNVKMVDILACAKLLIAKGADLNASSNVGTTPLMFATKELKLPLVELLLEKGADVNAVDLDGRSALEIAATHGYGKIVRVLLIHDADVLLVNEFGQTAIEVAVECGHAIISDILVQVGKTKWKPGKDVKDPQLMKEVAEPTLRKSIFKPSAVLDVHEKSQIEMVLENMALEKYIKVFEDHLISYLNFLTLDESDLKDIGIEDVEAREKLLQCISDIHKRDWIDQSVTPIYLKSNITPSEVICMLNNIKNHLDLITKNMRYLKRVATTRSEMLEAGIEQNSISEMIQVICQFKESTKSLQTEVNKYQSELAEIRGAATSSSRGKFTSLIKYASGHTWMKWGLVGVGLVVLGVSLRNRNHYSSSLNHLLKSRFTSKLT